MGGNNKQDSLQAPLLDPRQDLESFPPAGDEDTVCTLDAANNAKAGCKKGSHWLQTTASLLTLQLGWGLWLLPADYALLGWVPATAALVCLWLLTSYSSYLFTRLFTQTPGGVVLMGDIGGAAAGKLGRGLVYAIIYTLDGTRCVILQLAATQSLRHIFPEEHRPSVPLAGVIIGAVSLLLVQVRSMTKLSWFFLISTCSQLVGIGIAVHQLITFQDTEAHTENSAISWETWVPATVAFMNMIFAYGGQFAYVEVMSHMKEPVQFPRSCNLSLLIMSCMYGLLGAVGYWSRGSAIRGILIFNLGDTLPCRLAAACILLQATAQYLVNLNVWTHNLLTLHHRRSTSCQDLTSPRQQQAAAQQQIQCSSDHPRLKWFCTSLFVIFYSVVISSSVPFFSALVGIVTSATYLACAYTLPAWFTLRLFWDRVHVIERSFLLVLVIPLSIVFSAIGFWASVVALVNNIDTGGEGDL